MTDASAVRAKYDEIRERQVTRKARIQERIRRETEAEEASDWAELAALMHEAFDNGTTKVALREATRQYGNPKFKEIWDTIPYIPTERTETGTPTDKGYSKDGHLFTFYPGQWTHFPADRDHITLTAIYSEATGKWVLDTKGDPEIAAFTGHNVRELSPILRKEME